MTSSFGVDFGQKVDLTASIRNILRNYPEGTAILKELIQNADDANATAVTFILDHRSHETNTVADQALIGFQGPSLLIYNNAIFTEEDFNSIQRIGDSLKKSESTQAKIGRFGIGFNAVYHWTDLPSFISNKYLVMLDPQAKFLPNVNPSNPGKMIDFITYPDILAKYPDQFKPYAINSNHSWKVPYQGTMFRLPLRTSEQAKTSLLSKRSLTSIEANELLYSLQLEASRMLLFLKNINKIEIKEITNDLGPKLLYSCEINNFNNDMLKLRCMMSTYPIHLTQIQSNNEYHVQADYTMIIKCDDQNPKSNVNTSFKNPHSETWEVWEVCNQLGGKNINRIAIDSENISLRLVPWAGVATCISISTQHITESDYRNNNHSPTKQPTNNDNSNSFLIDMNPLYTQGQAYCFLPLPVYTGLPVMVNGFFELSSNRRDVWQDGADMTGDGKTRAIWNISLMRDILAPCYCRLLLRIRDLLDFSLQYQQLWPSWDVKHPWKEITRSMLQLTKHLKLLKQSLISNTDVDDNPIDTMKVKNITSKLSMTKKALKSVFLGSKSSTIKAMIGEEKRDDVWITCSDAVLIPKREGSLVSLSDSDEVELTNYLIEIDGIALVECEERLKITLIDSQTCTTIANPSYVRKLMKQCVLEIKDNPNQQMVTSTQGIPSIRLCKFLLKYCFSDVSLIGAPSTSVMQDLDLLPILPILNDSVSSLRIYSIEQVKSIDVLTSMGYSLTQSLFALNQMNFDMNNTCEYLSTNVNYQVMKTTSQNNSLLPGISNSRCYNKIDTILFLLDDSNYEIFQEASPILLNKKHIAPNEMDYLMNKHIQKYSNIRIFNPQYIPDLLRYILPTNCFDQMKVICSDFPLEVYEKLIFFLKSFWSYAATRNDVLQSIVLGACIVPSLGLKYLYPLSRMSNFIVQRKGDVFLNAVIADILTTIGVNIVDPLLASSSADSVEVMMASVFWEYVYSPSRHGILMTLEFILRNSSTANAFDVLNDQQRHELRLFLATCEPIKTISIQEIEIIQNLPIFQVNRSFSSLVSSDVIDTVKESNKRYVSILSRCSSAMADTNNSSKSKKERYIEKNTYADNNELPYITLTNYIQIIPDSLLPEYIIKYDTTQDYQLLKHLNVQVFSLVEFYRYIFFPNILYLYKIHKEDVLIILFYILDNINQIIQEDREFVNYIKTIAFIPSSSIDDNADNKVDDKVDNQVEVLYKANELFDPSCPDLNQLLGPEVFPNKRFHRSDYLIILRSLGLRKSLDWKGIIQCATSIAAMDDYILNIPVPVISISNDSKNDISPVSYIPNTTKVVRSCSLLRFLDKNIDHITSHVDLDSSKASKDNSTSYKAFPLFQLSSIFSTSTNSQKSISIDNNNKIKSKSDNSSNDNSQLTLQSFIDELRVIAWVPVVYERSDLLLPWPNHCINSISTSTSNSSSSIEKRTGILSICAAPIDTVPIKDAWFCSFTKRLVSQDITSVKFLELMQWNKTIPANVITLQLKKFSEKYLYLQKEEEEQNGILLEKEQTSSTSTNVKEIQKLREKLTELIPQFYQRFNSIASGNTYNSSNGSIVEPYLQVQKEELRRTLDNVAWIWVGDSFVTVDQVALNTTFNAAPYLYQLPQDLQVYTHLLSLFEIKSRFTPRDYIESLRQMAFDSKTMVRSLEANNATNQHLVDKPLSDIKLDVAISLATSLASESSINNLNGQNIYLPDNQGRLSVADTLVNDDVPWLSGPEYISVRSGCRLIHPNISTLVAEKLGVKSLRLFLLSKNLEQNLFSSFEGEIESFGQAESLTNRLKTILDMYPDGSPIFSELVQNADDAGATIIKILLDEHCYSCESLLDSKMSELQGPSLIVYNDAIFSEADFKCLAKIGQGSKLEKLATTGRFGLGFNSTYHLSDTPSVVSGDYLVIFDPHCTSVPGATTNQPGVRIRFTGSSLSSTFKDQFLPFQYFGCDVHQNFPGTLFRFPLRTAMQARKSEISKRSYSVSDVEVSLKQLVNQLSNMLIFLRNVQCIEIYRCGSSSSSSTTVHQEPILLHRSKSSKTKVEYINDQSLLTYFEKAMNNKSASIISSNTEQQQLSREGFYKRLLSTSDKELPKIFSKIHIVTDSFTTNNLYQNKYDNKVEDLSQKELVINNNQIVDYLVITGLCGGQAKRMACQDSLRHFKLIPMGAVAICIYMSEKNKEGIEIKAYIYPQIQGQAFCFLPLPTVQTHIPVHLNAYWELSSNRRDIWRGDDTTGEAKVRSDWNIHIMKDVLAPLYSLLLSKIHKEIISQSNCLDDITNNQITPSNDDLKINQHFKFLTMLPCPLPQVPWDNIAFALFEELKEQKLLWSKLNNGSYVSFKNAYLLEKTQNLLDKDELMNKQLEELLLMEQVPVVIVPSNIFKALLDCNSVAGEINPTFVRSIYHIKNNEYPHASLYQDHLSTDPKNIHSQTIIPKDKKKISIILNETTLKRVAFLLQYCLNDLSANSNGFTKLIGVNLLPLENNTLGHFSGATDANPYFLVNETERKLLQAAGSSIIASDAVLGQLVSSVLRDERFSQVCNVRIINSIDVLKLICTFIIPSNWLVASSSIVDMTDVISSDWLTSLWNYIIEANCIGMFYEVIPIIPIVSPHMIPSGSYLTKISTQIPVLHMYYKDVDKNAVKGLADLGIYIFDPTILGSKSYTNDMMKLLTPSSARGVLDAIVTRVSSLVPLDITNKSINRFLDSIISPMSSIRLGLQEFILDFVLSKISDDLKPKEIIALCSLPIWSISPTTYHVLDTSIIQLPPKDVDPCLLNTKFIYMRNEKDRSLYFKMGIQESSMGSFLVSNVIPQLLNSNSQQINQFINLLSYEKVEVLSTNILRNLSQLEKEHPGITNMLSNCPLFYCYDNNSNNLLNNNSNVNPKLYKAIDLYNPEITLLKSFIPTNYFPSSKLSNDAILLKGLISLGLKHTVNASDIIEIALSIQSELDRNVSSSSVSMTNNHISSSEKEQLIVNRGKGLLEYLDLHIEEIIQECSPESFIQDKKKDNEQNNDLGGSWASELRAIKWIPVYIRPPPPSHTLLIYSEDTIPWPSRTHSIALATPSQCNTIENIWLCSSTYRICLISVKSKLLLTVLGWIKPISGRVLASQLLGIKSLYDQSMIERNKEPYLETFDKILPIIYSHLNHAYERESLVEIDLWKTALSNKPIFWIKKQFVEPYRLAFKPISNLPLNVNTEPFLFVLDSEVHCIQQKSLLMTLGAREQFEGIDLANLTRDLYLVHKDIPLSATTFSLCVGIIDLISSLILGSSSSTIDSNSSPEGAVSEVINVNVTALADLGVIYVPDCQKLLQPASNLTYDDAPWLSNLLATDNSSNETSEHSHHNILFVHSKVDIITAREVGCKSLREQLFAGEDIICPDSERLHSLLDDDGIKDTLNDLLHIADHMNSQVLQILFDEQTYGTQSLLYPGLADTQGPALIAYIEGPIATYEQLIKLLNFHTQNFIDDIHPSNKYDVLSNNNQTNPLTLDTRKKYLPSSGKKLASAFAITDCLQVLTGNEMYIFDPCGYYLVTKHPSSSANPLSSNSNNIEIKEVNNNNDKNRKSFLKSKLKRAGSNLISKPAGTAIAQHYLLTNKLQKTGNLKSQNNNKFIDVLQQFPDQFSSILALKQLKCSETLQKDGFIQGILIRMPLRTTKSAISSQITSINEIKLAFGSFHGIISGSLLFANSLTEVSLYHKSNSTNIKTNEVHIPDIKMKLLSLPSLRSSRYNITEDKGWDKHGFSKFFSKVYTPNEALYSLMIELQINCYNNSNNNSMETMWIKPNPQLQLLIDQTNVISNNTNGIKSFQEEWLIGAINGYGRIKDLALMEPYISLSLQPFTTIAVQVLNEEQLIRYDVDPMAGVYYRSSSPCALTYLPFHMEGNFIESKLSIESITKSHLSNNNNNNNNNNENKLLNIFDSNNNSLQVRVQNWNDTIISICIDYLYSKLLFEIKRKIELNASKKNSLEEKNKILKGFYKYFIYYPRLSALVQKILLNTNMYWTCIIQNPLYLLPSSSSFQYLNEIILPSKQFHPEVNLYLESILPIANCPHQISKDISEIVPNNKFNTLTPKRLRNALSKNTKEQGQYLSNNIHLLKELLKYILSDMIENQMESEGEYNKRKKYRELCGCNLMLMADLSVKPYPNNASEQVAIAPLILHSLLPSLKSFLLHPTLFNDILLFKDPIILDSLFISNFSITFIDHHISHIIPSFWKLIPAICWIKTNESFNNFAGYFTRFLNRTITSPSTVVHNNNEVINNSPSPLLIYVLWNNYFCKETDINALNKLKDYPLVPVISKNRRLLFSISLLPHIFSLTSNNQQDQARSNLKREIGRMASLYKGGIDELDKKIPMLETFSSDHKQNTEWLWTTKRTGDYDIIEETIESKPEEESNNIIPIAQPLEIHHHTINAEDVTPVDTTLTSSSGVANTNSIIPVAITVSNDIDVHDDELGMIQGLQAASTSASSDVIEAMTALGVPFFDNSLFESIPLFASQSQSMNNISGVHYLASNMQGRRVLQCLHRLDQFNISIQSAVSSGESLDEVVASTESLLMYDQLSISHRNKLLLHIFQDHTTMQPFSSNEITQLKELRLFTNQVTKAAVSFAECESAGVYWCLDQSVLESINISSINDSIVIDRNSVYTPSSSQSNISVTTNKNAVILYFEPSLRELYTFLGIEELTASTAVRKFTIPLLFKMDAFTRIEVILGLAKKWNTIYRTDQSLVQQLKELPFIPLWDFHSSNTTTAATPNNSNTNTSINLNEIRMYNMNYLNSTADLRKANDLILWTNHDLLDALAGKDAPRYFSPPYLRSTELHLMCSDLGMKIDLTEDILKDIVLDIEKDANIALESASNDELVRIDLLHTTSDRGRRILRYIRHEDRISTLLQNVNYARALGKIRFVPMNFPESVSYGGFVSYRKDIGRFDQLVSKAQGSLAFTVMPIIEDDIAPPQYYYSFLGVTGMPKLEIVLRHIRNLTNLGEALDHWNANYSIIQTFNAVFQYLTDQWKNISPQIKSSLSEAYLIPVGHLLIKPNRLFFKLTEDLSPFMHEIPRHFGGHEDFLKSIGIREYPVIADYLHFLNDLAIECGTSTLNPNELKAVVAILQVIANQLYTETTTTSNITNTVSKPDENKSQNKISGLDNIYLPDEHAYMRHISLCLYNDNDWLANKINLSLINSNLFLVHPSISIDIVKLLDIYRLTNVIVESVDVESQKENNTADFEIKQKEIIYQELFSNEFFIDSLSPLLLQCYSSINNNNNHNASNHTITATTATSTELSINNMHVMKSHIIKSLKSLRLLFVQQLKTNYHLLHPRTHKKILLHENTLDTEKQRLYFLTKSIQSSITTDNEGWSDEILYINYYHIRPPLSIEMIISSGLCQRFHIDMSLSFAIGTLLQAKSTNDTQMILNSLHINLPNNITNSNNNNNFLLQSRQRGIPGEEVLESDRILLELKPFRVFRIGEIVAYQMQSVNHTIDDTNIKDNYTKDNNIDGNNSKDIIIYAKVMSISTAAESGIRRLNIKVNINEVISILSTEIFSFKSARELQNKKQQQQQQVKSSPIYNTISSMIQKANSSTPIVNNNLKNTSDNNVNISSNTSITTPTTANTIERKDMIAHEEVLSAVNSLLTRAGLPFDLNQQNMVSRIMSLEEEKKRIEKELISERQQLVRSKELIEQVESDMKCPICCSANVSFVLNPCGHTLCEQCVTLMRSSRCPHCRTNIQNTVKFFLPGHSTNK